MSLRVPIDNQTKLIILLVGITATMAVVAATSGVPYDQVCREIHDYSKQAPEEDSPYDLDPERQLDVFKQEIGDSWVSGYYDEKTDSLHMCMKKT